MTVGELIAELQKHPQDMPVRVLDGEWPYAGVELYVADVGHQTINPTFDVLWISTKAAS